MVHLFQNQGTSWWTWTTNPHILQVAIIPQIWYTELPPLLIFAISFDRMSCTAEVDRRESINAITLPWSFTTGFKVCRRKYCARKWPCSKLILPPFHVKCYHNKAVFYILVLCCNVSYVLLQYNKQSWRRVSQQLPEWEFKQHNSYGNESSSIIEFPSGT